ncbi:MAG: beta-sandwich domain-containing protein [Myxococcaceae bacterium]
MPTTPLRSITLGALGLLLLAAPASAAGTISGKLAAKNAKFLKNAVVYVEHAASSGPAKTVQMDQKGQVFIPFVLPVVKGSTVEFLNNDDTGHNVFSPDGEKFDLGVFTKDQSRKYPITREGAYTILCKMHPSMIAYIVSLQNPHFAVTSDDGSFTIPDVPPGEYTLKVWHERKKAEPVKVTVPATGTATAKLELR